MPDDPRCHLETRSSPRQLHHPAGAAGGLVAAVKQVGDLVQVLRPRGGVAGGGPQVDVTEPGRDRMHGHAWPPGNGWPCRGTAKIRLKSALGRSEARKAVFERRSALTLHVRDASGGLRICPNGWLEAAERLSAVLMYFSALCWPYRSPRSWRSRCSS